MSILLVVALAFVIQVNVGNKDNGAHIMFGGDGHDEMAYDIIHNITGVPKISFCNATLDPYIIYDIKWSPNNVVPGETLTVSVIGRLTEEVTAGKIHEKATAAGIVVVDDTLDLCDEIPPPLKCPLSIGSLNLTQSVQIPKAPAVMVKSNTSIVDQNNNQLACILVSVRL
mmetsp:Transcript_74269/g.91223  ORF Transcript_74269/g.91223 Transcript_74269/m.91223 type:complete len:170 (-) Transcript_74269:66-575(-)